MASPYPIPTHDIHPMGSGQRPLLGLIGPDLVLDLAHGAVALSERDDPMLCNPVWLQLSQCSSSDAQSARVLCSDPSHSDSKKTKPNSRLSSRLLTLFAINDCGLSHEV
ncbi:hypothetical protein HYE67_003890 [Fusarium culmorum]|uniref:Uncharacterized protein n=1 Tax=Fusarium culmorum TaxID=5516 RepID=A0A2T4GN81_FUSCU|nr:hypothetical protein FCULG_00001061 [Fusarium culmorum]QPC61659.1 hypothetical protein HYE67_003890 [Fusarium culmorum]